MVAVFSIFGSLSQPSMKEIGTGLAVAALLDATIVRAVLLPASMKLLGDWNWWLRSGCPGCRSLNRGTPRTPAPEAVTA